MITKDEHKEVGISDTVAVLSTVAAPLWAVFCTQERPCM